MNILYIGDIFGSLGRKAVDEYLLKIKQDYNINLVFANGENAAHGRGITEKIYKSLMSQGISVISMGNHTFDNQGVYSIMEQDNHLIRPINYEAELPGKGYTLLNYNGVKICVINIMGRVYTIQPVTSPFSALDQVLAQVEADIYIVDFHAEATSEKIAFGYYADGRVNAVVGTHTHVPTSDARLLDNNTAYITDIGMTGPLDGVIGMDRENVTKKFITGLPLRYQPKDDGKKQFNAVVLQIDDHTFQTKKIIPIRIFE